MSLIKGKAQDLAPVVDLIPSLRMFVEAGGLRAEDLSVGFAQPTKQAPPLPRTVLTLYHLDELSIPEIAQVTGLAAGTIKSHLFRTRLKLRETLETRLGVMP